MTKREILVAICDSPGWQPPADAPPSMTQAIDQLAIEGWIGARKPHGYEATDQALDAYPVFEGQKDIRDRSQGLVIPPAPAQDGRPAHPGNEVTLPSLFIRNEQRAETKFHVGTVQGTVVVANEQSLSPLVEVVVTVNVKPA